MKKYITFLCVFILLFSIGNAVSAPLYSASVQVYNQDGQPLAGVPVRMELHTTLAYEWDVRTTDSNGYVYIPLTAPGFLDYMFVTITNSNYQILSKQGWYTETGYYMYPTLTVTTVTVIDDVDGNGVHDPWEMPLAEKFCPTMVANPHASTNKWIVPEPVEIMTHSMFAKRYLYPTGTPVDDIFLLTTEDWDYSLAQTPMTWNDPPGGSIEYFVIWHFEWAGLTGNGPTDWENAYQSERTNNYYAHTIYAHLFKYDAQTYVIQYWFFYPYNDGYNNHEGDWEHINVLVTSQDPASANFIRVDYYLHHKVTIRNFPNFEIEDNTHPRVYIGGTAAGGNYGLNTGGSYPEIGTWNNIGPLGADEYVFGFGPVITYSNYIDGNPNDGRGIVILKERDKYDYMQDPEMSWLNADLPWGHITVGSPWNWQPFVDIGNHAPVGPAHNKGWNRIGSVYGDGGYDLYTAQPGPLP